MVRVIETSKELEKSRQLIEDAHRDYELGVPRHATDPNPNRAPHNNIFESRDSPKCRL
jgi:hypothetical protein